MISFCNLQVATYVIFCSVLKLNVVVVVVNFFQGTATHDKTQTNWPNIPNFHLITTTATDQGRPYQQVEKPFEKDQPFQTSQPPPPNPRFSLEQQNSPLSVLQQHSTNLEQCWKNGDKDKERQNNRVLLSDTTNI